MKTTLIAPRHRPLRAMQGLSMVELMIAMVLGLMVLAGLASLFAGSSASRQEMERNSRQIENGRFAMELLSDDLRMAGFYGELDASVAVVPGALTDPCSTTASVWTDSVRLAVQAYDTGASPPTCLPTDVVAGTDILVVRRASTCEVGATGCDAAVSTLPYVQVSKCSPENTLTPFVIATSGHTLRLRNCTGTAGKRRYYVRIYYLSTNNGAGVTVPTLKRYDVFTGQTEALVEGIENINFEYGVDHDADGNPNDYTANPTTYAPAGCGTCAAAANWMNVVTVRINLLARNIDPSPNFTDTKTYTLGRNAAGAEITVTPGGAYRRHTYTGVVRVLNVAQRKEFPT